MIDFFQQFIGNYTPNTYVETQKIATYNPTTTLIEVETWTNNVIPSGLGSVDFEYITRLIILLMIMYLMYSIPKWSLQLFENSSKRFKRLK